MLKKMKGLEPGENTGFEESDSRILAFGYPAKAMATSVAKPRAAYPSFVLVFSTGSCPHDLGKECPGKVLVLFVCFVLMQ